MKVVEEPRPNTHSHTHTHKHIRRINTHIWVPKHSLCCVGYSSMQPGYCIATFLVVLVALAVASRVADMQHAKCNNNNNNDNNNNNSLCPTQAVVARTVWMFQLLRSFLIIDNSPAIDFGNLSPPQPATTRQNRRNRPPSACCCGSKPGYGVRSPPWPSNALKCFFVKTSYTLQFALNPTWLWQGIAPLGNESIA